MKKNFDVLKRIKKEEAEAVRKAVQEKYPDCDVELHYGGQPIYYYYIALE